MEPSQLMMFAVVGVAFYLLLIRPQQKQAKRQREMVENLAPGDEIVTIGGIFATVVSVTDSRIRVALVDGAELEIAPRAVSEVAEQKAEDDAEDAQAETDEPSRDADVSNAAAEDADR